MAAYVLRRILYTVPILIGITLITFLLFNVVGRNPALMQAGKNATVEQIKMIEHELGLDRPLHEQYLHFVKQIVTLDFGRSWSTKQTVTSMIDAGLGASLSLTIPAFLLATFLSLALAVFAAYFRGTIWDKSIVTLSLAGMSISILVYILFFQYFFAYKLEWFPISGYDNSWTGRWEYVALGWIIWVVVSLGSQVLFFRTVILDEVFQDYVRTARAKGLDEKRVYFKHILKNAMIPVITVLVLEIPFLFTGSLFIESFFGIPGLGGMMIKALQASDFPVIKAMTFIGSALYLVFAIIADLAYAWVDPRIKLS